MSYKDFTLPEIREKFDLQVVGNQSLFFNVEPVRLSEWLVTLFENSIRVATNVNTEKARSEFIIAPLLLDLRQRQQTPVSLFSGVEFNVDASLGLTGRCDFIISEAGDELFLDAPILILVEAKNENIIAGIPQCLAEMIAAQKFNEQKKRIRNNIYGVVSTGTAWRFLKLTGKTAFVDTIEYLLEDGTKIFGILNYIVQNAVKSD